MGLRGKVLGNESFNANPIRLNQGINCPLEPSSVIRKHGPLEVVCLGPFRRSDSVVLFRLGLGFE
jgi:hypothetical protein